MHAKSDILDQVDTVHARLEEALTGVDEAHGTWDGALGAWSIVNVLQHLTGWLEEMAPGLERMARGERPTPEGVDYSSFDDWNAGFLQARGSQSLTDARTAFDAAHIAFRAAITGLDDDRFGEGKTANRLVDGIIVEHYAEHAEQIEAFLSGAH